MLKHGEAKVLIVPQVFRGFDFEKMVEGLQGDLPDLAHVGGRRQRRQQLRCPAQRPGLGGQRRRAGDPRARSRPGPDDVTQLIYTSGTTGEPKGVMHTANTTMANIIPYAQRLRLGADDVVLMASPMAHQTGFMYGLMMPIMLKASVVLQDIWEPRPGARADPQRAGQLHHGLDAVPDGPDPRRRGAPAGGADLRTFLRAGAPIPGPPGRTGPGRAGYQDRVGLGHERERRRLP